MENNLGSLSYSLNIDLDKDVVAKIEKQLANIDVFNKVAFTGDLTGLETAIQKVLNKSYDLKIEADPEAAEQLRAKYEEILNTIRQTSGVSKEMSVQIASEQSALLSIKKEREEINKAVKEGTMTEDQSL